MNKINALLILILCCPIHVSAGDASPVETAETYFAAVKTGDVATIHNLTGPPLSEQIATLVTNNAEYPEFLRTHFQGASAVIGDVIALKADEQQVDLIITYADNRVSLIRLTMTRKQPDMWNVIGQQEVID